MNEEVLKILWETVQAGETRSSQLLEFEGVQEIGELEKRLAGLKKKLEDRKREEDKVRKS